MYSAELLKKVTQKFSDVSEIPPKEKFVRDPEPQLMVPAEKIQAVCAYLKEDPDMAFDLPIQMTAVDYIEENQFEMVYYVYSVRHKHAIVLKSRISRENASIDSITNVWAGMDWQEREVFDLFGINFNHHPDLRRIMMWDGFPGYPLRKDYVHVTDRYDSGVEVGTPGHDDKGLPVKKDTPA